MSIRQSSRRNHLNLGLRKQAGFIQAMLIGGIALLSVIAAAVAYFNRGASSNFDKETQRVNATLVVTTGNDLRMAIQRWQQDNSGTPVLSTAEGMVYDPALGLASPRSLPAKLFDRDDSGVSDFAYDTATVTVGADAVPEHALMLPELTDDVCKQINRMVNDADLADAIPTAWQASGEGCAKVGAAANAYFKVVEFKQ